MYVNILFVACSFGSSRFEEKDKRENKFISRLHRAITCKSITGFFLERQPSMAGGQMKVLIIGLLGKEKFREDNRIRGGGVVGVVKQFTGLRGCTAR